MLVLRGNGVVVEQVGQLGDKADDLVVVRDVLHGQRRGLAVAAEGHALDLDEAGLPERHKLGIRLNLRVVPAAHHRQPVHGALFLWRGKQLGLG